MKSNLISVGGSVLKNKGLIASILMIILTAGFTGALLYVDVQPIGPGGTEVGLATMNSMFQELVGVNYTCYNIAEILGYVIWGIFGIFALAGFIQMIKRRSIVKVDSNILVLGGMYFILFALYVLFSKVAVNYRPIILPGEMMPEPSFPSSHTMMAIVVAVGTMMQLKYYVKRKSARVFFMFDLIVIMLMTVATRTLSGAHWLSDIIAGILFSLTLISLYCAVYNVVKDRAKH